jgi:hypothetical protein
MYKLVRIIVVTLANAELKKNATLYKSDHHRSRSNVKHWGHRKNGARQVLGRVNYASWSTLPINHPNVNFRGHTRG